MTAVGEGGGRPCRPASQSNLEQQVHEEGADRNGNQCPFEEADDKLLQLHGNPCGKHHDDGFREENNLYHGYGHDHVTCPLGKHRYLI